MLRTSIYLYIIFLILLFNISFKSAIAVEKYSPSVKIGTIPKRPSPDSGVQIFANVTDRFSMIDIKNARINYSVNNNKNASQSSHMNLTWGTPSNGTFIGTIPIQKENTRVNYTVYFKDNLGYFNDSKGEYFVKRDITNPIFIKFPKLTNVIANPLHKVSFTFIIKGEGSAIKNATLYYRINTTASRFSQPIPLNRISGDNWMGTYIAKIPNNYPANTLVKYFVEAYNSAGNRRIQSGWYLIKNINSSQGEMRDNIHVTGIDGQNLTASAKIGIHGHAPEFLLNEDRGIEAINAHNITDTFSKDPFVIPLRHELGPFNNTVDPFGTNINTTKHDYASILSGNALKSNDEFFSNNGTDFKPPQLRLIGDTSKFPFDRYNLTLILAIPAQNMRLENIITYDKSVDSSWVPKIHVSNLSGQYIIHFFNNTFPKLIPELNPNRNNVTFQKVDLELQRKYNFGAPIYLVTVPLFAIFFFLGATFVFKSSLIDQLAARFAITIGMFTFLFTFSPIIDKQKPAIINGIPTVADFLVTAIILSTIAYTIGSAIGYNTRRVRGALIVDIIIFVIMAGFISVFVNLYKITIEPWQIIIIILGLGYGLIGQLFQEKKYEREEKEEKKMN